MLAVHPWSSTGPERAGSVLMVSTVSELSVSFAAGIFHIEDSLINNLPVRNFHYCSFMSDCEGLAMGECGVSV